MGDSAEDWVGSAVPRLEDAALLSGNARLSMTCRRCPEYGTWHCCAHLILMRGFAKSIRGTRSHCRAL